MTSETKENQPAKKKSVKKTVKKKTAAKEPVAKKTAAKKSAVKKTAVKKSAVKKTVKKKTATKKVPVKKSVKAPVAETSEKTVLEKPVVDVAQKTVNQESEKKIETPRIKDVEVRKQPEIQTSKPELDQPEKVNQKTDMKEIPVKPVDSPVIQKKTEIKAPANQDIKPSPVQKTSSGTPDSKISRDASASTEEEVLSDLFQTVELAMPVTVRDLAEAIKIKASDLIKDFMKIGVFASMNQSVNMEQAANIAKDYGFIIKTPDAAVTDLAEIHHVKVDPSKLKPRPSIVTFMGHVDHGKTSLLDKIRDAKVVDSESGGITQHIGAYEVVLDQGAVTFLDTPGHEAFTAMRARGAKTTDIAVIVVAADDGLQPQTLEAIDHAKAAEVPIVVAINKCDLPTANVERVKQQLSERDLATEDWGGKTVAVKVSAKTGDGIDDLLDMLLLESEMLELKANPEAPARGAVIEARMSKDSGATVTLLVQDGTLSVSDCIVCGNFSGRVRAMINDRGIRVKTAGPSVPVEILGLAGVPEAGDTFFVVKNETKAKEYIEKKQMQNREASLGGNAHVSLDQLYESIQQGKIQKLNIIIKADTQGSAEALSAMLGQIKNDQVKLSIIHTGTGDVTRNDVMLASASNAIIVGFHVSIAPESADLAKREGVDVRLYKIIYEAEDAIRKALEGMLEPEVVEVEIGTAEVRQVFKISKLGVIAGSKVAKGKLIRNAKCKVFRNGQQIHESKLHGLKRFKNDAREVLEGFECGILINGFTDIQEGDEVRAYETEVSSNQALSSK